MQNLHQSLLAEFRSSTSAGRQRSQLENLLPRHRESPPFENGFEFLEVGGEGRNRTSPPTPSVGATVLRTATTTRHASLSRQMQISTRRNGKQRSVAVSKTRAQ